MDQAVVRIDGKLAEEVRKDLGTNAKRGRIPKGPFPAWLLPSLALPRRAMPGRV